MSWVVLISSVLRGVVFHGSLAMDRLEAAVRAAQGPILGYVEENDGNFRGFFGLRCIEGEAEAGKVGCVAGQHGRLG